MIYTPPNGDNIEFNFTDGGYSAPTADSISFEFAAGNPDDLAISVIVKSDAATPGLSRDWFLTVQTDVTSQASVGVFGQIRPLSVSAIVESDAAAPVLFRDWFLNADVSVDSAASFGGLWVVRYLDIDVTVETSATVAAEIVLSIHSTISTPWSEYSGVIDLSFQALWGFATPLDSGNSLVWAFPWAATGLADVSFALDWVPVGPQDVENILPWGGTLYQDAKKKIPWLQGVALNPENIWPWAKTEETDVDTILPWNKTAGVDVNFDLPWTLVAAMDLEARLAWAKTEAIDPAARVPWSKTIPMDVSNFTRFEKGYIDEARKHLFKSFKLPWMAAARLIMSKQNITLTRVSDGQDIALVSGSVDIDVDSWCWEARITLPSKANADLVRPDPTTGELTEVELSVNGYVWRLLVKPITENYAWAKGTYNIVAYSPSYLLGDPGPRVTNTWSAQPAETVISDLLYGSGFTYTWNLLSNTWNLDAGSLSVTDATWMEIIKTIPAAVGGVVQTDPDGYNLTLQSRYPISPKNWSGCGPDETLLSGIMSQGINPRPLPKYDEIIVSGKTTGVIATVRREGEPGDNPAPAIVDPLLTNQAVVKERGRVELDTQGYNKADEALILPLPGPGNSPKLLLPGYLVQVQDLHNNWRGQVKGVNVAFELAKTRQRATVERVYL